MNIQSALSNLLTGPIVYRHVKRGKYIERLYYCIKDGELYVSSTPDFDGKHCVTVVFRDEFLFSFEEVMDEHWQIHYGQTYMGDEGN